MTFKFLGGFIDEPMAGDPEYVVTMEQFFVGRGSRVRITKRWLGGALNGTSDAISFPYSQLPALQELIGNAMSASPAPPATKEASVRIPRERR
jgi:hypothetical protein